MSAVYKPVAALALILSVTTSGQQAASPTQPPAQQRPDSQMPPITFRAEVNHVEVNAVVRDAQGQFIPDLRREDFQILENGKPQDVATFFLVDMPVTRGDRPLFTERAIEPDVRTNVGTLDGRVYVLLLDDLHTSPMRAPLVRRAARQFVERNFGANDVAAVVHASGRQDAGQEFTSNPRLLLEAIDKFGGRKLRSPTLERIDEYNRMVSRMETINRVNDPLAFERAYHARSILSTISSIANLLAGVSGRRKAVLMFSEGIDYDISDFMGQDSLTIITETRDTITAATRANVNLYTIDPRGLNSMGDDTMEMQPPMDAEPQHNLGLTGVMNELRLSQDSLRVLAEQTGGFAAVNANDFTDAYERIVRENSTYYVLGYYPQNAKRDGTYRKIDVRVTRPGAQVLARRGYVAPRGRPKANAGIETRAGTSRELAEALNSPLQTSGLPLVVFAAPFRGPAPKAAVAIVTQAGSGESLTFSEKDGKYTNVLEVSAIAVDVQGKVRGGTRDKVDLALRADTYERLRQLGFRIQSRLEVPPGRYQLRVALKDSGGKVGSVHYDLVVPDFTTEPLSMSGLVISSAMGGMVPTAGVVPEIKDALPGPPTAARAFGTRDQLAVLAEVYDTDGLTPHSVEITTSLRASDGRVAFTTAETRKSTELGGKTGGYGYTAMMPLSGVTPGLYVLRVDAKSTLQNRSASREVLIRVQ